MKLISGCISETGNYRKKNQDRAVCCVHYDRKHTLALGCVCDGIGSFPTSEISAEMVISGITRWFKGIIPYCFKNIQEEDLLEDLEETLVEINELVYTYKEQKEINIGCTMSLMLVIDEKYYIFQVGDSRIYCLRNALQQITEDQVVYREEKGITKKKLANYFGRRKDLVLEKYVGDIQNEDIFVVATDGFYKRLRYDDIKDISQKMKNDKAALQCCERLVKLVLERGEKDNISCVLLRAAKKNLLLQ